MATASIAGLEAHLAGLGLKVPIPDFPDLDILRDPLHIARSYLADSVHTIVGGQAEHSFSAVQLPQSVDPAGGDLTIILPKLAKEVGKTVDQLTVLLTENFPKHPLFQQPLPDGKQLKIYFHSQALAQIVLPFINDRATVFGLPQVPSNHPKPKVLLEFSSPNIVTEFNGKHFRSSLLGAQLAAAYKAQGWDVTQINYLGDYGKPIGLLGVGYEEFGSPELLASEPLSHLRSVYRQISDRFAPELATSKKARDDPKTREAVGETADIESRGIYAKRNAYFSLLESDDQKIVTLWKTLRDASIESYRRTYSRLDIDFDEYAGESQVKAETMSDVITKLKDKNICEESEGSLVVHLNKYRSKHGTAILRDRSGSSTYLLREVAATIERLEKYAFDKMIYVVAHDQHNTHFHRLVKILELLEMSTLGDKLDHVGFAEGSAIPASLVAGEPIDAILDRMEDHMRQNLELEASKLKGLPLGYLTEKTLAATACYSLASSVKRATELKATADSMIGFGPGLVMYPLVWLGRLSELSGTEEEFVKDEEENYLDDDDTAILLRWLAHYPAVVQASFRTAEPAVVMSYIGTVTSHLADAYDEDEKISPVSFEHLRMLVAVRTILANALELLKIIRVRPRDSGVFL